MGMKYEEDPFTMVMFLTIKGVLHNRSVFRLPTHTSRHSILESLTRQPRSLLSWYCAPMAQYYIRGLPLITYAPRGGGGGGGQSLLYISIAYYMQKGGEGVQIACKNSYVINGRPLRGEARDKTHTYMLL